MDSVLIVGGVQMIAGWYLPSGFEELSETKPEEVGYAYFDGSILTLHNYIYSGGGSKAGEISIGVDVWDLTLGITLEGNNAVVVDALERGIGMRIEGSAVTINGRGSLTIHAQNGMFGNYGIFGSGTLKIRSGKVMVSVGLPPYELINGKKKYEGDSYAIYVGRLIETGLHVIGRDRIGSHLNKNNTTQITFETQRRSPVGVGLLLAASLALTISVWAIFFRSPVVLAPDYAPVDSEEYAEKMPDGEEEKLSKPEGGGAIGAEYSTDVDVTLANQKMDLYFGNPKRSNEDVVLQLVIKDTVVAQSGTIHPGMKVEKLNLLDGAADKLKTGGYDGTMKVLSYDEETGERAILATDIAVNVTVTT